ncbi:MAG: hypothetical protein Q4D38_04875 [Planctomycetia bacterium]|nr:hypothetical protein [Planctomycetia bacterium]
MFRLFLVGILCCALPTYAAEFELAPNDVFGFTLQSGAALPDKAPSCSLVFEWTSGEPTTLTLQTTDVEHLLVQDARGAKKGEKIILNDAAILLTMGRVRLTQHIRPHVRRYQTWSSAVPAYGEILAKWEQYPPASKHPLKVEFRQAPTSLQLYLDGSYICVIPPAEENARLKKVRCTLAPSASYRDTFQRKIAASERQFYPLDFSRWPKSQPSLGGKANLVPDPRLVDVGICREGQGNWALEVDEYLSRSPLDAFPTAVHLRVPTGAYYRVWVNFIVDDDPKKDPILTTRLTRYMDSPGVGVNLIADTTEVFDEKRLEKCERIGSLRRNGKEYPVYRTSIAIDLGKILDAAAGTLWSDVATQTQEFKGDYLDFEFLGKTIEGIHQIDNRCKPDPNSTSAIMVLGATLESAPVLPVLTQTHPGNVHYASDARAGMAFVPHVFFDAQKKGDFQYEVYDIDGVKQYDRILSASEPGFLDMKPFKTGFYWFDLSWRDASGTKCWTHRGSFSVLPPNERRAEYDSPYGLWWFCGVHYCSKDIPYVGELYYKVGARNYYSSGYTEAELTPYKLTKRQTNVSASGNFSLLAPDGKALKPEGYEAIDREVKQNLERYPHMKEVCIFHESGPGWDIPYEVYGKPMKFREGQEARHRRYGQIYEAVGKYMRQKYPQLRLVVGNSSSATPTIGATFRFGADTRYIDYIGNEATGQQFIPEKMCDGGTQGQHIAVEAARIFTGKKIPVTGCYEFTARAERMIGYTRQAQWYSRDMLIGLASGWSTIGISSIIDTSNAYYNTLWGAAGIMHRSPYAYPKPVYQAYAVLTNVFDQVRSPREIRTGSSTVYAVEMNRYTRKPGEGTFAAALWTARGNARVKITLDKVAKVRIIDMYGREVVGDQSVFSLEIGESPYYLISDARIRSVEIEKRSFPDDATRAAASVVVAPLDSTAQVRLSPDTSLDTIFDGRNIYWPVRLRSEFVLEDVEDERGVKVRLDVEKNKDWSRFITEYVRIDVLTPNAISPTTNPAGIGVWVKGNSNWGRVMFELEDAEGEIWRSVGESDWGCDAFDWPGYASVNFDGWNYIAVPLRKTSFFTAYGPSEAKGQWIAIGRGDRVMKGPMKLRALYVEMFRQKLNLTQFETSEPSIILRDVGFFDFPNAQD